MVGILNNLLISLNQAFAKKYKQPIWSPALLGSKQFLGGSSLAFFDTTGISDAEFLKHKPKVGDLDTQCDVNLKPQLQEFLDSIRGKHVGNATFLGYTNAAEQFNALFLLDDPKVNGEPVIKMQIDFEFGEYAQGSPTEWYRFSHSSDWADISRGVKGVFHKWLFRALTGTVSSSTKYVVDVKKTKTTVSPEPVTDNNLSFAVASGQGGGMSIKYEPYKDPATGKSKKDGVPLMRLIPSAQREYVQNLAQQFELLFGQEPDRDELKLQQSFIGTCQLMNKYLDEEQKQQTVKYLIDICFEPGQAQMIDRDDPDSDRDVKFAAIDAMLIGDKQNKPALTVSNAKALRAEAVKMQAAYAQDYYDVEAYKKQFPGATRPRSDMKKAMAAGTWAPQR
jgi:hypothetical protein